MRRDGFLTDKNFSTFISFVKGYALYKKSIESDIPAIKALAPTILANLQPLCDQLDLEINSSGGID